MYQSIQTKLHQIATSEPLHLLLAVESGSRAWGFPSPDSDYDVRAIYIKQPENYLCIDEQKDTFEYIENQWFDVGGWDIRKALRLPCCLNGCARRLCTRKMMNLFTPLPNSPRNTPKLHPCCTTIAASLATLCPLWI